MDYKLFYFYIAIVLAYILRIGIYIRSSLNKFEAAPYIIDPLAVSVLLSRNPRGYLIIRNSGDNTDEGKVRTNQQH